MKSLFVSVAVVCASLSVFAGPKDLQLQQSMFLAGASGIVVNDKTILTSIKKVNCYTSHGGSCLFETQIEADVDESTTMTESMQLVGPLAMGLSNALIDFGAFNFEVRAGGSAVRASEVTCVQPFLVGEVPTAENTHCVVNK